MSELEPPRQSRLIVWAIVLGAAVIAGVLLWLFFRPPNTARFEPLVQAAEHNTLPAEVNGAIDISKQFPGITADGNMYLHRWPDGRFAAFFPTYTAPGPVATGLMYVSSPLRPTDTYARDALIHFDKPLIDIGTYRHLRIDRKLNEHWYRVSYGME